MLGCSTDQVSRLMYLAVRFLACILLLNNKPNMQHGKVNTFINETMPTTEIYESAQEGTST